MLRVNAERLRDDMLTAASFGRTESGAVNRPAFSDADISVRKWFAGRAKEAGLEAKTDSLRNVIVGDPSDTPGVWTGSHLDTVPHGGMFDGALGAIVGLECVRRIAESGIELTKPVRTIAFSDEEGSYLGFLGSRGLWNGLTNGDEQELGELGQISGYAGKTLADALTGAGGDLLKAAQAQLQPGIVEHFIELHVEQGPNLEAEGINIGVVSHIVGVGRCIVEFTGRPDHAGTTPMHLRQDALRGAAKFIDVIADIPEQVGRPDAVVTCGTVNVTPGAVNVVPGTVTVELDFRDIEQEGLDSLATAIHRAAAWAAAEADVRCEVTPGSMTPPVEMCSDIAATIDSTALDLGLSRKTMYSGAGHDSQVMANLAPIGMVFVPSHEGRSHSHLEHTDWEDVVNGANVLLGTLLGYATNSSK